MRTEFFTRAPAKPAPGHRTYSGPRTLNNPLPRIDHEHLRAVLDARRALCLDEGVTL
ncbi:hypothetical protein [Sphingomonas jaspsi]|uniref:hypothetical protein n=1 Tax=Sphingomonas jaspsi TaxID=392409 RepID=UPI0004B4DFB0|nr:hypothetical protein [Sphingomonas jaspsi]